MKKLSLFCVFALLCSVSVFAEDFEVDGIYYYFLGGDSVEVIYDWGSWESYSGDIEIPSTVTYGGTTYRVTSIGDYAFSGCDGLTSITIPNSVTSIDDYAFESCSSLTSITIPNSVTSIRDFAFSGCDNLYIVYYTGTIADWCAIEFRDNPLHRYSGANFYINDVRVTDLVFPDGMTTIEDWFRGCKSIESITIPNSVTSIGNSAFFNCSGLTSVTIPNSVTEIGGKAFFNSSLTSITIPNSITSIKDSTFYFCGNLTSVVWNAKNCADFPGKNTPFYYYDDYDELEICTPITSFTLGDKVEHIPAYLCYEMSKLKSIIIPNSVTSIGNGAFSGCSGLTSITIPNSVITIGSYAFSGWINLTSLTIPESVTSIGDYAFNSCSGLTYITARSATPPTTGSNAFYHVPTGAEVSVPCGAAPAYRVATGWSNFTHITENFVYTFDVKSQDENTGLVQIVQAPSCSQAAIVKALPMDGYKFAMWSDGNTQSMRSIKVESDVELVALFVPTSGGTEVTEVEVTPTDNTAGFVWPSVDGTATYTLIIWADEAQTERICTLTFDAIGRLTNIDFSASPKQVQSPSSIGLNFTVTGLTPNTTYLYDIIAQDTEGTVIDTKSGRFTTKGSNEEVEYILTVLSDDETKGSVRIIQQPLAENNNTAIFEAVPAQGYKFTAWNDGVKTNPRTEVLTEDATFVASFELLNDALETPEIISDIYAHDGGIYGANDLQIFNLVGQEVTHLNGALSNGIYIVRVGDKTQKVFVGR